MLFLLDITPLPSRQERVDKLKSAVIAQCNSKLTKQLEVISLLIEEIERLEKGDLIDSGTIDISVYDDFDISLDIYGDLGTNKIYISNEYYPRITFYNGQKDLMDDECVCKYERNRTLLKKEVLITNFLNIK